MRFYPSITICLALMAGVTANGCFAQSAVNPNNQEQSVADDSTPVTATANPAVMPVAPASVGKTRAQVMRELEDFQNSDQAAQMRELYRGGS